MRPIYILCLCLLVGLMVVEVRQLYGLGEHDTIDTSLADVKDENNKYKQEKIAYLSFDDGPSENTKKVMNTLDKKNACATFFLIGCEITHDRVEIVKELVARGNVVGVHTYSHEQDFIYADKQSIFDDYERCEKAIEDVTGAKPVLHRFPWGSNNGYVSAHVDEWHEILKEKGIRSYDWNVSGEDSISMDVPGETIYENVKKDLTRFDKPIILLHDGASMDNTAAVLGDIIDYIRGEGYTFDTLDHREEYMFPSSWR